MFYIIIAIALLFLSIKYKDKTKTGNASYSQRLYWFLFFVLFIIPAIRYRVGGDTLEYMDEYYLFPSLKELTLSSFSEFRYQPLWILFVALLKSVSQEFVFLQIVHAFIINFVLFKVFAKYCNNVYLAVFLYYINSYFLFNFEVIREALAICVFLLGLEYCRNGKWLKYITISIICFLIHDSAIVFFLVPILYGRKISFNNIWLLVVFSVACILISSYIIEIMSFFAFISETFILRANEYMVSLDSFNSNSIIYRLIISVLFPFVVYYICTIKKGIKTPVDDFALFYFVIGIISSCIPPLYRFGNYQFVFSIIYLACCYNEYKLHYTKSILLTYLLCGCILFIGYFKIYSYFFKDTAYIESNTRGYVLFYPYHTVFDPIEEYSRENFVVTIKSHNY